MINTTISFFFNCVQVDTDELEDARWFHADFLAAQLRAASRGSRAPPVARGAGAGSEAPFRIPGPYALANRIISSWLHQRQQRERPPAGGGSAEDASALAALAAVPDVAIDEGSFKYVLLRLSTADGEALVCEEHAPRAPACAAGPARPHAGMVHARSSLPSSHPQPSAAAASPAGLHSKLLVRGDSRAAYHNHILQHCSAEVRALAPDAGLRLETLGALPGWAVHFWIGLVWPLGGVCGLLLSTPAALAHHWRAVECAAPSFIRRRWRPHGALSGAARAVGVWLQLSIRPSAP